MRRERIAERAAGPGRHPRQQRRAPSEIKPLDELTDADCYAAFELNVMAPMRLMRHFAPLMAERGWGRIVNVTSTRGQAAVADLAGLLGRQGRAALALARCTPTAGRRAACTSTPSRRARPARRCGAPRAGSPSRSRRARASAPDEAIERHVGQGAARPLRRARRGRRRHRLPLLRARVVGDRRGLVGRRRHLAVDALAEADDHVAERDRRRIGRRDEFVGLQA